LSCYRNTITFLSDYNLTKCLSRLVVRNLKAFLSSLLFFIKRSISSSFSSFSLAFR
jgi:hypothetical protein